MKIKKIIGYVFFLIAISLVSYTYFRKKERYKEFLKASEEILLKVDGEKFGQVGEFQISYRYAHGIHIENAEVINDKDAYDSANIKLIQHENIVYLRFKNGEKTGGTVQHLSKNIVEVINPFAGQITFGNRVCGCETLGPELLFLGSCVIGFIFAILGFIFVKDMIFG